AAIAGGEFTSCSVAVAYATLGGVKAFERRMEQGLGDRWRAMQKRWLVGIDWCRSDPPALRRLSAIQNSAVKIPSGRTLVASACMPRDTFHPKLFMFDGPRLTSVVCGSGNLSVNGLTRGCECGSVVVVDRMDQHFQEPIEQTTRLHHWFETA